MWCSVGDFLLYFESFKVQIFYSHIFLSNGFHMGKKEDGPSIGQVGQGMVKKITNFLIYNIMQT